MKNKSLLKSIIIIILIAGLIFILNKFNIFKGYGPNEIKDFIQDKGILAPVIYVILLSSLPLLLFPDSVIVIAGGMVFGLFGGTILTVLGSLIGATIAFFLSRKLGQGMVKRLVKRELVIFNKDDKQSGFFLILILRLIPLFPFKIVSYSAGLSDIRFKDFAMATMFGSLPGILVYTNLGDKTTVFGSKEFYLSIILLVVLFMASFILKKIFAKRDETN